MLLCGSDTFILQVMQSTSSRRALQVQSFIYVLVESPVERVPEVHNWVDLESAHWDIVSD